mmetsp:Transcript_499/g.1606  ORF Transcript_499/g.1606 Transcript_499/m.1606 type:complete len:127 (-) Transcript_499:10-390(-)
MGQAPPGHAGPSQRSSASSSGNGDSRSAQPSETVEKEVRFAFDKMDTDGKGSISMKELVKAVKLLAQNPTKAELEELIRQVKESDFDARVDYPNFRLIILRTLQNPDSNRLSDAERDAMIKQALGW